MEETLKQIVEAAESEAASVKTRPEFEAYKARFVGPKGSFTQARKLMGQVPKEEKPAFGKRLNEVKEALENRFARLISEIEQAELAARLGPAVDPTLPSPDLPPGNRHILNQVRDEICAVFRRIGFTVAEGTELETDYYCFEALNFPPDHPARDMQDTYLMPNGTHVANVSRKGSEPYLLRTHTSTVQIRTMLAEKPPLRIVSPGRCFRRDTTDATHSANFHQIEGLYVDHKVSVADLKAVLDYFAREIFGKGAEVRLRPSFFPFTEPSFELDFRAPNMGKLSNRWLEIMGCGIVDPSVFESVGYDPQEWTGYAFGMGVERIAMLLCGIDDIRLFYQNDLRFLRQFA